MLFHARVQSWICIPNGFKSQGFHVQSVREYCTINVDDLLPHLLCTELARLRHAAGSYVGRNGSLKDVDDAMHCIISAAGQYFCVLDLTLNFRIELRRAVEDGGSHVQNQLSLLCTGL